MTVENKSSGNKVIKAGIAYTIGNYLIKGMRFLTIPIFTRLLSTEDYGLYNTYIAYESILFLIIGCQLHTSFKNAKYKFRDSFNKYVSSCVHFLLVSLGVWILIANIFYPSYSNVIMFERWIVNILVIHSFGSALILYFNSYIGLDYKYTEFVKLSSFNAIFSVIGSILLIITIFNRQAYQGRIVGTVIPIILISIYIIIYFSKKERIKINKGYLKFGLIYSLPIIPHGISQVLLSQFDRIMINNLNGGVQAGIYSFAYNIYTIISVTTSSLDTVWGPWFYERMNRKDYDAIREQGKKYATGMFGFSTIILLFSPELIKILGTKEYWSAIYCVVPIVVGGYFTFLYTLPAQIEYYYEKTKTIAAGTVVAAIINITLNLYFIPKYGYVAAAYTTLVTYLLYFIFHYVLSIKVHGGKIYSHRNILFCIIGILLMGGVTLLLVSSMLIRWTIALIIIIFMLFWIGKEFGILQKFLEKCKNLI